MTAEVAIMNAIGVAMAADSAVTQRETVGGPIDVAVITRGDGFIWIRRKHYFEPSLNPRAMAKFAAS